MQVLLELQLVLPVIDLDEQRVAARAALPEGLDDLVRVRVRVRGRVRVRVRVRVKVRVRVRVRS